MIRFFGFLFSFLSVAAIAGLGGIMALVSIYDEDLPSYEELADYRPPLLSRVYSGEGRVIAEFARQRRIFVPYDEVPDVVIEAFISAEDKNFFTHPGVDAIGIIKAFGRFATARIAGRSTRLTGASTITQQVMKNFLVGDDRSIERKIKEAILAVRIEGALSKGQILELYLNEIFLGARSYGIVAAAQNYFGKSLEELTPAEAAYLAALPQRPSNLHPIRNHDEALARRNYVLTEMYQNGYLTFEEYQAERATPLETILGERTPTVLADVDRNYFTAEIRRQLVAEMGEDGLYEGGLTIRATIDPELQRLAEQALRRGLEKFDRQRGTYHGPITRIDEIVSGAEDPDWRRLLDETEAPRDIDGWHVAVVLAVDGDGASIGIEDYGIDPAEEPVDGYEQGAELPEDLPEPAAEGPLGPGTARLSVAAERQWLSRVTQPDGSTSRLREASDLWAVGDVIHVRRDEDGGWSLRQVPEVQGAFMAMDPLTGRVLALQGGFSFEHSVFNRATQALRQPGSSFKPFVYAAALDAGYTPATIVLDAPVVVRAGGRRWAPQNSSGRFYGPSPLRVGLEQSRNLMTVRIAQQIGMDRVAQYAERFGVYEDMPHHLSYALGAGETTLFNMVAAYGMFANGGKRVEPTLVDRIQDRFGRTLFRHDPRQCQGCDAAEYTPGAEPLLFDARAQIMDPVTAFQLVSMMQGVVNRGTASRTVGGLPFPVAGKTGTTNDAKDAWFVGFSSNLVAGCFIGYDDPRPMGRGAYGGTLCGPVFREFMAAALAERGAGPFREPDRGTNVIVVKIDRFTGQRLPDDASGPNVIVEVFQRGSEPQLYADAGSIMGDAALFGSVGDDLPYSLGSSEEYQFEGETPTSGGDSTAGATRRPPPTEVGIGTGGLY